MEYCPVIVKIEQLLVDKFCGDTGYQYLLQVWNSENEKVYEVPLISKLSFA